MVKNRLIIISMLCSYLFIVVIIKFSNKVWYRWSTSRERVTKEWRPWTGFDYQSSSSLEFWHILLINFSILFIYFTKEWRPWTGFNYQSSSSLEFWPILLINFPPLFIYTSQKNEDPEQVSIINHLNHLTQLPQNNIIITLVDIFIVSANFNVWVVKNDFL